ncbi:Hydrophobin [Penicillium maclennaniae]|uniref:Hydrophobin n=1 Tax=Penicillium maclennaniae TaxID=1343394 RepID=UPI00254213CC|nr:Hydrophobin [Penicillium maclennaniae]KAJ5665044.1 Hydrophobin [Penicillium maclennaniae]
MQFSLTAITLALASVAVALPSQAGLESQGSDIRWKVPAGMTVLEAQSKCGDQAQLSCCNKAIYAADTTDINSGLGGGLLSNLMGSGSGAEGAGIFDQCTKLNAHIPVVAGIPIQDLLNQQCKQNIACCANSPPPPPTTCSVLPFPVLPRLLPELQLRKGPLLLCLAVL